MLRPRHRIPALLAAILAVPGNVDNLMPQMRLDPNDLANNTAPAVSVVDLLIVWALVLTWREGRMRWPARRIERWAVLAALVAAGLATTSAVAAVVSGVEFAASLRGSIVFLRVPLLLLLVVSLRDELNQGRLLAFAAAIGVVALLANGVYTSTANDLTRFTASTVGRNGFALALVLAGTLAGGSALALFSERGRIGWVIVGLGTLAAAAFFASVATGTRMSLLAFVPALVLGLALTRFWRPPRRVVPVAVAVAVLVLAVAAGGVLTSEGGRAVSVVTDFGETVDIITDPEGQPSYSPVRSRTLFWRQALVMFAEHPVTGVGPFQWNFLRYQMDSEATEVVADPHNAYLQIAAEYGLPTLIVYTALTALIILSALLNAWRSGSPLVFTATALLIASLVYPATELTNSHLFNVRLGPTGWIIMASALVIFVGQDAAVRSRDEVVRETSGLMR